MTLFGVLAAHGQRCPTLQNSNAPCVFKAMEHLVHPRRREVLRQAIPHEMFKRDGVAMVANGAVWFDAKGAKVLNFP